MLLKINNLLYSLKSKNWYINDFPLFASKTIGLSNRLSFLVACYLRITKPRNQSYLQLPRDLKLESQMGFRQYSVPHLVQKVNDREMPLGAYKRGENICNMFMEQTNSTLSEDLKVNRNISAFENF